MITLTRREATEALEALKLRVRWYDTRRIDPPGEMVSALHGVAAALEVDRATLRR